MSSITTTALSSLTSAMSALPDMAMKRYSLVKWLENSQFDVHNEWLGRLTSVPHTNIIDFDPDELKAGIEINVIRNNGEIWRAQVIIPKTASNTIDLPPSSYKKIRTKAMGTTGKLSSDLESQIDLATQAALELHEFEEKHDNMIILSGKDANADNAPAAVANDKNVEEKSSPATQTPATKSNASNKNKEWQYLQTVINDAGLTDMYQPYTDMTQPIAQTTNLANSLNKFISNSNTVVTVNDMNIETILQMQCELLDQQKELKVIELETMEHLKQLNQNISKLAKKFDSFEMSLSGSYSALANQTGFNSSFNCISQESLQTLKTAKNAFGKLNTTIGQQLKLVDSELLKELCQPSTTAATTTVSLLSPSILNGASTHGGLTLLSSLNDNKSTNSNILNMQLMQPISKPQQQQSATILTTSKIQLVPSTSITSSPPVFATTLATTNGTSSIQLENNSNNIATTTTANKTVIDLNESNTLASNFSKEITSMNSELNNCEMSTNGDASPGNASSKAQGIQTQISLNRFLRESVKQKLGADFLLTNAVSDIPMTIMRAIKKEAFDKYLPHDRRPIKAWGLAMASLRCLKRDLVKNKNKQLAAAAAATAANSSPVSSTESIDPKQQFTGTGTGGGLQVKRAGINITVASSLQTKTRSSIPKFEVK